MESLEQLLGGLDRDMVFIIATIMVVPLILAAVKKLIKLAVGVLTVIIIIAVVGMYSGTALPELPVNIQNGTIVIQALGEQVDLAIDTIDKIVVNGVEEGQKITVHAGERQVNFTVPTETLGLIISFAEDNNITVQINQ